MSAHLRAFLRKRLARLPEDFGYVVKRRSTGLTLQAAQSLFHGSELLFRLTEFRLMPIELIRQ